MTALDLLKHIGSVIKIDRGYDSDQVLLWNQKFTTPSDDRVYIILSIVSDKVMSVKVEYDHDAEKEVRSSNHAPLVGIEIVSKGTQALIDKDLILMSLNSDASQFAQTKYGFKIAKLPPQVTAINEQEGAAVLYRFNLPLIAYYFHSEEKSNNYYEFFNEAQITED